MRNAKTQKQQLEDMVSMQSDEIAKLKAQVDAMRTALLKLQDLGCDELDICKVDSIVSNALEGDKYAR